MNTLMKPVNSSNIDYIGYSLNDKLLVVTFKTAPGLPYLYKDVPPALFDALMNADSVGSFFNKYIKKYYTAQSFKFEPRPESEPLPTQENEVTQ